MASGYVVSTGTQFVGVQLMMKATGIGLDRVCAWAMFALLGVGCWWKAEPGRIPVMEAAKLPALHQMEGEGEQVTAVAWIRAGSAHEAVGREGLACAVVHAQLSSSMNEEPQRLQRLTRAGFKWDIDVGREIVQIRLQAEPSAVEDLAGLLGDVLLAVPSPDAPRLPSIADSNSARSVFLKWLYAGHPYGHAPECGQSSTPAWTADEMRYFFEDRYIRVSTQLSVEIPKGAGAIDLSEPFQAMLDRLEAMPATLYKDVSPRMVPRPFEARLAFAEDAEGEIWMGWGTGLHPGHADWTSFLIATELLSQRLRSIQEAGRSVPSDWINEQGQTPDWVGLPMIWGWTEVSEPNSLVEHAIPMISDWISGPYTETEIERAKQRIRSRLMQGSEERAVQAGLLGWTQGWGRVVAELETVGSDEVTAAIARHVALSDLRILMGPALQVDQNDPDIEEMEDFSVDIDVSPGYDWKMGVPLRLSLQEP